VIKDLEPYLKHIGNCGASDSCAIDDRCICGLRQIYFREEVRYTQLESKALRIDELENPLSVFAE